MFVRTDRLLLRPGWIEDAPALAHAVCEQVARGTARIPWPYREAHARDYLGLVADPRTPACLIFARTARAPRLIGGVGVSPDGDGLELGYWIARPFWGLGFATEAAAALLRTARESLRLGRIGAAHFADNPASGRVLQKLGFRPTGRAVRRRSVARGAEVDCLLYAEAAEAACEAQAMRCLEAA